MPAGPYRIEFFGDQIESMRRFEPDTQRSVLKVQEATLLPLIEYPKSRKLFTEIAEAAEVRDRRHRRALPRLGVAGAARAPARRLPAQPGRAADRLWDEPEQLRGAAERLWKRLEDPEREAPIPPEKVFFRWEEFEAQARRGAQVRAPRAGNFARRRCAAHRHTPGHDLPRQHAGGRRRGAQLVERGGRVAFFAATNGELERLADILQEYSVPFQLGLEPSGAHALLPGRARLPGGLRGQHASWSAGWSGAA